MPELSDTLRQVVALSETKAEKKKAAALVQQAEWEECEKDPWYFITTHCKTQDEHAATLGIETFRTIDPSKWYLELLVRIWMKHHKLLVPKSRQIMISWIGVLLILYWCLFHEGQLWVIQSKKEEDADALCKRMFGVWERLPAWMRKRAPATLNKCKIHFPTLQNDVLGIPEGGDQIRSRTPSGILSDESAFQPQFAEAFAASQPAVHGGGRFMGVSSAKAGAFFELTEAPMEPGTKEVLIESWSDKQGMVTWETVMGWKVVQIHYSADPKKDEVWAEDFSRTFRGGRAGADWQAEMEIDPGARAGRRVFPAFNRSTHVIEPFDWEPYGWPYFIGIDPGFATRCAVAFMTMDEDGCFYVVDELYEQQTKIPAMAGMIKIRIGRKRPQFIAIGHDAYAESQGEANTIAMQYSREGLDCQPAYTKKIDWIPLFADAIDLLANGQPRFKVFSSCPNMIHEMEKFRYLELSEQQKAKKDTPEEPMKKDDHLIHAARNVVVSVPHDFMNRYGMESRTGQEKLQTVSQQMRARYLVAGPQRGGMFDDD